MQMEHPQRVTELVLRGIFLVREKELKWLYQGYLYVTDCIIALKKRLGFAGPGANMLFPEDWENYVAAIPEEERGDFIAAYGRRLRGELGEQGE